MAAGPLSGPGGKSGLHQGQGATRKGGWGDPKESATEKKPPRPSVKGRGKAETVV